ncbi:MAG TPA: hypothetical protein VFM10_12620 [Terriglobales bacterium]|jgi:hypothetical protein|nr:hypothetical protein [Terriglobales bacterium]
MMDPRFSKILKSALSFWLTSAIEHVKDHAERMEELKKCTAGDQGEVRIIYHVKANVVSLETLNMAEGKFRELFREQLAPEDAGFALPPD